jgi:plastocyanin domain-containing protein
MKTVYIAIFLIMLVAGGLVLSHSISNTKSVNSAGVLGAGTSVQVIKATYSLVLGLEPKTFTVKSGSPVRLEINAVDNGLGCMGSVTIPGLNNKVEGFVKGQTNVFEFTPKAAGEYSITCAMGVPHGTIRVE